MEVKNDFSFKIAALTVIKRDNKFLLIRRSNLETMSGVWEFPAGKLEFSENLEQCAIRETEEETSIKVKKLKSIGYHERYDKEKIDHVIFHDFFAVDFEGK